MKKKNIILASILGASALAAGVTGVILADSNNQNNIALEESLSFNESNLAEDDIFAQGFSSEKLEYPVLMTESETSEIVKPKIGCQYAYDDVNGTVSIRFFAAIASEKVNAVWTRALYDSNGNETSVLSKGTRQSTVAYKNISWMDGDTILTRGATEEEDENGNHPYNYYVIYTITDIPVSIYSNFELRAYLELSNNECTINSKTGSVNPTETPDLSSYEIKLDMNNISGSNGNYTTGKAKTIYSMSEDLNTNNIVPYYDNTAVTIESVTGYTKGKAGKQTLTVNTAYGAANYDIYVVDEDPYYDSNRDEYVVSVSKDWDGEIGEIYSSSGNIFITIGQALEFLQNPNIVPSSAKKYMWIEPGYYYEKLEITTPNLTIHGTGAYIAKGTYSGDINYDSDEFANSTIIEYDSLYGVTEANGFVQSTNSTQTVQISESATNCTIRNLTISNWWNNNARFISEYDYLKDIHYYDSNKQEEVYLASNDEIKEHRALAILIRADQFVMEDCALLGYQDTIELFKGRQYFNKTYISGVTDFIFGTNNTTLFDECEIHTIDNGQIDGGYINAFKGTHYDDGRDAVKYGAIYFKCNFTNDITVVNSNTAIARAWAPYSKVAIIECNLGSHISTEAYTANTTKNQRYVAWNSNGDNAPTLDTVEYVEYGNEGSGAISATQNGMTYLTESEAADYHDYSVIFGKTNGNVSYALAWDPTAEPIIEKDFVFNLTGNYLTASEIDLSEFTSVQEKPDTIGFQGKIKVSVKANSLVEIIGYSDGYVKYTVDGYKVYADSSFYYSTAGTLVIDTGTTTSYINSIKIYENIADADSVVLSSITIEDTPLNDFLVGDACDISGIKVKANYSNGTYEYINNYTTDVATAVDNTIADTYTITVTYDNGTVSKTATFTVTYVGTIDNTISEDIITSFKGNNYSAYNANVFASTFNSASEDVTIDKITYSKIQSNGSAGNWISYSNGSSITMEVDSACALYLGFYYSSGVSSATVAINNKTVSKCRLFRYDTKAEIDSLRDQYGDFARYVISEAGTITVTFSGNGYLGAVGVLFNDGIIEDDAVIEDDLTISFATNGNGYGAIEGVKNTCTVSDHNDGSAQIKNGKITLSLKSAATITINGNYAIDFTIGGNVIKSTNAGGSYSSTIYECDAEAGDFVITIGDTGNNYFCSIEVEYKEEQKVISTTTRIAFGKGSSSNYQDLISTGYLTSTCQTWDNADDSTRFHAGYLEFYVNQGATVTIFGNYHVDYVANGDEVSGSVDYNTGQHVVTYGSDGKITIVCDSDGNGDNYFYWIDVTY